MMMLRRLLKSGSNKRDKDKSKSSKNGRLNSTKPEHLQSRADSASFSASESGVAGGRPFPASRELDVDYIDNSLPNEDNSPEREWRTEQETAIGAKQLHTQFVTKHADEDLLFRSEFEKIPEYIASVGVKCDCARRPENASKNRYKNVVTSDRSRVKLKIQNDDPFSDYINATYIDGYDCKKKFIAAQGPKENTLDDFWRMIWEQRCFVVVMITQLHEMGRKKCELYWPNEGESCTYGSIKVTNNSKISHGTFVRRMLQIQHLETEETRDISQFQFLVWPDHGVPKSTSDIFRFRDRTLEAQPKDAGPILVHCSAGVGRTGTYIGLDVLLQQLHGRGKIDPLTLVVNFRLRRSEMVQSLEQYVLLHKLLDEWRTLGRTEFTIDNFVEKYDKLVSTGGIETEFKRVVNCLPLNTRLGRGTFEQNRIKNRDEHIVPYEHGQITIGMWPTEQIPVYYNASPLLTYEQGMPLIAAQGPMKNTCEDFWRAVLDNNVAIIIMLNPLDPAQPDVDYQYWPLVKDEIINLDENVTVTALSDPSPHESCDDVTITRLSVQCTRHEHTSVRDLVHIHYTCWEDADEISNLQQILFLRQLMLDEMKLLADERPEPKTLIHCSNGCGRTGVFCSLINSLAYLNNEKLVDVSRSVKDLRDSRPHMVQTLKQYRLCYELVLKHIQLLNSPSPPNGSKSCEMSEEEDNLKPTHEPIDLMKDLEHFGKLRCSIQLSKDEGTSEVGDGDAATNGKEQDPNDQPSSVEECPTEDAKLIIENQNAGLNGEEEQETVSEENVSRQEHDIDSNVEEDTDPKEQKTNSNVEDNSQKEQDSDSAEEDTSQKEQGSAPLEEDNTQKEQDVTSIEEDNAQKEQDVASIEEDNAQKEQGSALIEEDNAKKEQDSAPLEEDNAQKEQDVASIEEDNAQKEQDSTLIEEDNAQKEQNVTSIEEDNAQKEQGVTSIEEDNAQKEQDVTSIEEDNAQKEQDVTSIEEDNAQKEQDVTSIEEDNAQKEQDVTSIEEDNAQKQQDSDSGEEDTAQKQETDSVEDNAQKEQNINTNDEGTATPEQDSESSEENTAPKERNIDSADENLEATDQQQDTAESEKETNPNANKSVHGGAGDQQQKCYPKEEEQ